MEMCMKICPCKRTDCPRHGDCEACREHHHASDRKQLTRCEKPEKKKRGKRSKLSFGVKGKSVKAEDQMIK